MAGKSDRHLGNLWTLLAIMWAFTAHALAKIGPVNAPPFSRGHFSLRWAGTVRRLAQCWSLNVHNLMAVITQRTLPFAVARSCPFPGQVADSSLLRDQGEEQSPALVYEQIGEMRVEHGLYESCRLSPP